MVPNDTAYTRCSCHSGLANPVQIVWNPPARLPFFWASQSCGPAGWLVLLLIKAGDVDMNPGPTSIHKQVWIWDIYHRQIQVRKHISIRCNMIKTLGVPKMRRYPPSTIYRYLDPPSTHIILTHNNKHRLNTTPPSQTKPPIPPHIQVSPCSLRIGKTQTQSSHQEHLPPRPESNTYTCHALHLSPHSSQARQLH